MWTSPRSCRDETELQRLSKIEVITSHLVFLWSSGGLTHGPEQQYSTLSDDSVKKVTSCVESERNFFFFFLNSLLLTFLNFALLSST